MIIRELITRIGIRVEDRQLARFENSIDNVLGGVQKIGSAIDKNIGQPIRKFAADSLGVFESFELQIAKTAAVLGKTPKEIDALRKSAMKLGASTIFTASQVALLQTEYAKLGFSEAQILKMQKSTLALAQATDEDLGKTAAVVGSTLRQFGLDASQTARVTDVMAKSFSISALDLTKFKNTMKTVGPVAAAAGLDLEKTTAFIAQLANSGISGTKAGTGLRKSLLELGIQGTELDEVIKGLTDKKTSLATAERLVGKTGVAALSVLLKQQKGYAGVEKQLRNAEGAALKMSKTMNKTLFGAFRAFESAIEGVNIAFGQFLAKFVEPIIRKATDVVTAFNNLSESTKNIIFTILSGAGAFATLLGVLGSVAGAIVAAIALFSALNPVVLVVVGVLAALSANLTAIALIIQRDWTKFKPLFMDLRDSAIELFQAIGRLVAAIFDVKATEFDEFIDLISMSIGFMVTNITKAVDALTFLIDKYTKLSNLIKNNPVLATAANIGRAPITGGGLGGLAARAGGALRSTIDLNSNVSVQVPDGTPAQQESFLEETAKRIFGKELSRVIKGAAANAPRGAF